MLSRPLCDHLCLLFSIFLHPNSRLLVFGVQKSGKPIGFFFFLKKYILNTAAASESLPAFMAISWFILVLLRGYVLIFDVLFEGYSINKWIECDFRLTFYTNGCFERLDLWREFIESFISFTATVGFIRFYGPFLYYEYILDES